MITEILLRTYSPCYFRLAQTMQKLIVENTDLKVTLVDHRYMNKTLFPYEEGETLVSIDRHIAHQLNIPYYRISRVFNRNGNVLGRYEAGIITEIGPNVRILDSDIVNGDTIRYACSRFNTTKFSVPLIVLPHQDLIDIEDIMENNSIVLGDSTKLKNPVNIERSMRSYLETIDMFVARTSLPEKMYDIFETLKYDYMNSEPLY